MPQPVYVATSQSFPFFMPGAPVRRGPIESLSTWPSRATCELLIPSSQIFRTTGSPVGQLCARAADGASATESATAAAASALAPIVVNAGRAGGGATRGMSCERCKERMTSVGVR